MKKIITEELLDNFQLYMREGEKSPSTIKKYMCDVRKLQKYAHGKEITKKMMVEYKAYLIEICHYKERSANSFLVAANSFLQFAGWNDLVVKSYKIQCEMFCPDERYLTKEEYKKLVNTAKALGKHRLAMILQTICATGIRVSELKYVTVQTVEKGIVNVRNKGKSRRVFLPKKLRIILKKYIKEHTIAEGCVFITSKGKAVERSNIWREMKAICEKANVDQSKVFPHNLRHLFAQNYYALEKDIVKLADIMGHNNIETTRIYIKSTEAEHLKLLEQMGLVID